VSGGHVVFSLTHERGRTKHRRFTIERSGITTYDCCEARFWRENRPGFMPMQTGINARPATA
jgi:hypothetical protein